MEGMAANNCPECCMRKRVSGGRGIIAVYWSHPSPGRNNWLSKVPISAEQMRKTYLILKLIIRLTGQSEDSCLYAVMERKRC